MDNKEQHQDALEKTGYWGKAGAGCLILAKDTQRFLFPLRGPDVLQPNTWGTWGGAIDEGEDPSDAVLREVEEECGLVATKDQLEPLFTYEGDNGFKYYNFILTVDKEFTPILNNETSQVAWKSQDNFPTPMHFGLVSIRDFLIAKTVISQI